MATLVVYESWFGTTRELAQAIAAELHRHGEVSLLSVDDPAPPLEGFELLVVGAPTHAHGLSSAATRDAALEQANSAGEVGAGMRGWLQQLPPGAGRRAAVFDTRFELPRLLVGSAARGVAKRLSRRGYELVVAPESFFVLGTPAELKAGELERAAAWARSLAGRGLSAAA